LIPGEEGRKEGEHTEERGDKAEIRGESSGGVQGTHVWEYSNLGWLFGCISFLGGFLVSLLDSGAFPLDEFTISVDTTDIVVYLMIFWTALGNSEVLSKFSSSLSLTRGLLFVMMGFKLSELLNRPSVVHVTVLDESTLFSITSVIPVIQIHNLTEFQCLTCSQ